MAQSTRATAVLKAAQIAFSVHSYEYDGAAPSIGLHAAAALGMPASIVFKTLMLNVDGKACCAILPSDQTLSMKRVAVALEGKSADMMKPADAERTTGYKIGGISPLGQMKRVPIVLDEHALNLPAIYINGGQRGLQILLSPHDFATMVTKVAQITA